MSGDHIFCTNSKSCPAVLKLPFRKSGTNFPNDLKKAGRANPLATELDVHGLAIRRTCGELFMVSVLQKAGRLFEKKKYRLNWRHEVRWGRGEVFIVQSNLRSSINLIISQWNLNHPWEKQIYEGKKRSQIKIGVNCPNNKRSKKWI